MLLFAAACGGDSSTKTPGGSPQAGSPVVVLQAAALLPKLDDMGYVLAQQGKDPLAPPTVDTAQAIYAKPNGNNRSIQVRIFVMGTPDLARTQYRTYADQFRNPPPDVLGIASKNVDALSPKVGDEQKSYVTEKPDGQGNAVWTDIYRVGRVVFFLQVLDTATGDQMQLRTAVADRIASKAK